MVTKDPTKSVVRAWQVAINPRNHSKLNRRLLLERGAQYYSTNGEANEKAMINDVAEFTACAFQEPELDEMLAGESDPEDATDIDLTNPDPGRLMLLMTFGSVLVQRHPKIQKDSRDCIIHERLHEYYLNNVYRAARTSEHGDEIYTALGTVVYERDKEDEYGPPAGEPVEGIDTLEPLGDAKFFKVPLAHANRHCEARKDNKPGGDIQSIIRGKYVYVPLSDHVKKYRDAFFGRSGVARCLEEIVYDNIPEDKLDTYRDALTGINNKITEWIEYGEADKVFKAHRYPPKLKAILLAIDHVDSEVAAFGEPLTSKQIARATSIFHGATDIDWVKKTLEGLTSPQGVGMVLVDLANDSDVDNVEVDTHVDPNEYLIEYHKSNAKVVEVTELEDLLELPCMQNIHEMAMSDSAPRRWYLFSMVRIILELETDFSVEDIKEWFSQYPWYREKITDYQVRYEKKQDIEGESPLPVGCNNDNRNFEDVCIGRENCDYSIYQSLNFSDDVYNRLSEDDDGYGRR
ncbi:primase-associated protein [Halovenus salina]|uniref:Primase-associated protein n=1 Tax=Halovenus salina TaxID=1510225 RepID=A0ABD5W906_9EURY|nr:primase-associated protein [Halovenus salina]